MKKDFNFTTSPDEIKNFHTNIYVILLIFPEISCELATTQFELVRFKAFKKIRFNYLFPFLQQ